MDGAPASGDRRPSPSDVMNGSVLARERIIDGYNTTTPPSGGSINAKYKLMSPAKLPISRSPCITIPPGLSPTSFLDSPVFLSNFKGEPSPTTGSFFKPKMMHISSGVSTLPSIINKSDTLDGSNSSGFEFKPNSGSFSAGGFSFSESLVPFPDFSQQAGLAMRIQQETHSQSPDPSATVKSEAGGSTEVRSSTANSGFGILPEVDSIELKQRADSNNEAQASQSEQKGVGTQVITSDDGYNWRKYGQKLVKGSEYPRSYYKCTHPNCEVKKLFERSPDGQIVEIIYKGTHDHPKPQPNRRLPTGFMMSTLEEKSERVTGQEGNLPAPFGQTSHNCDESSKPQLPACAENDNIGEGNASQLNRIIDDADNDDPYAKRRRLEIGELEINSVVKPIREPRVVVQTVSEVDILDDGYRWRKYGQKVVRGNPNPRSYYKCTHPGCPVRKHVERASHDPKSVITTYEGKHNHEVPTARNTNNNNRHDALERASHPSSISQQAVSLDLGVGLRSAPDFGPGSTGPAQFASPNILLLHHQPGQISNFPGYLNGENGIGNGNQPVNHSSSSNPYQQNLGRILMGP